MSVFNQKLFSKYANRLSLSLADLDNWAYTVQPITPLKELVREFEVNPKVPGVLVIESDQFRGMISRNTCFEKLSRPFSLDLFLQKPIGDLLTHFSIPCEVFHATTSIQEAVPIVLSRPIRYLYEPIVINLDSKNYRLIDVHDLLLAQNRLLQDSNAKISQQVRISKALASTLDLKKLIESIWEIIEEIIPHSQKMMIANLYGQERIQLSHNLANQYNLEYLLHQIEESIRNVNLDDLSYLPIMIQHFEFEYANKALCKEEIERWILFPLIHSDDILGHLLVGRFFPLDAGEQQFESHELDHLYSFCSMFSTALRNSQLYDEVQQAAFFDPMTKVLNRRGLFDQTQERNFQQLTAIMIDIDHFKKINDTFGHLAGDLLIKEVVHKFQDILRSKDRIGRYGGDEFVILLEEIETSQALQVAERMRSSIENANFVIDGNTIPITISIGVAQMLQGESMDSLLARADQQLYHAKESGRNRVQTALAINQITKSI